MAKICGACGRTCETRYDWAHHGCEVAGGQREANWRARTPAPAPAAEATAARGVIPAKQPAPAAPKR